MENNKYYIPAIEDIRTGYECEIATHNTIQPWIKTIVTQQNSNYKGVLQSIHPYRIYDEIEQGNVRTPFLTKEQIEAEGWEIKDGFIKKGSGWAGDDNVYFLELHDNYRILIDNGQCYGDRHIYFDGRCQSINEFRTISKLLGI